MDPVTGLIGLLGLSLASVAGLRLKKNIEEGYTSIPGTNTKENQSRYNMFSGMVNPITNSIIPVGSSSALIKRQKETVNGALGGYSAEFSPDSSQTLVLKRFENQFQPRSDTNNSLYGAMKFCREAGKGESPFSILDEDGAVKVQGAVSPDGKWKFDEMCGVCITSGVDEEGNRFRRTQGMLLEDNERQNAIDEQQKNGWAYPRVKPSIGTCEGAPNNPVFATSASDLQRFQARHTCVDSKTIGGPDNCALCFESDSVFSSVPTNAQTYPVYFTLQGTGTVVLKIQGKVVGQKTLSETTPIEMELVNAKEGDTFLLEVSNTTSSSTLNIYGYLHSKNPRDGLYTMPLNLLTTIDAETGSSPSKTGGFYTFTDVGLDVAKMRPSSGKTSMRLQGVLPFTFIQPSEFAAMDCLDTPFQTKASSASAFSSDQPCFAKGSGPGKYNDACLRQRILDAGCTNAGTLYKTPNILNMKGGAPQTITQIYAALQGVAALDMVDPDATKQCSGRKIETPCDPFILKAGTMKFADSLRSTNATTKAQAQQCLSYLYSNKGASETVNPPRVGATYTGLVTYMNNRKGVKNIYCLPEGALNPDTNAAGRETLVRIADNGYSGKIGVEAIKAYLNEQLVLATDVLRNANTDPDRKAAIINCFGTNLNALPAAVTGNPTVIQDSCGIVAQYVRVLPSKEIDDAFIEISQIAVIDKNGQNIARGKSTTGTTEAWPSSPTFGNMGIANATDGQVYPKATNFYHSATPGGSTQFVLNLGKPTDITKVIFITRGDNRTTHYRKKGIRLQLLDANQNVLNEKILSNSIREDVSYLKTGAAASCKSDIAAAAPITFPTGYTPGLFVRFYDMNDSNPDITPGNRGWGGRIGTPNAYGKLNFTERSLAKADKCGLVAKGYYIASGPETLYLYTESDDGIYVSFNNRQVISNWTLRTSAKADSSAPITIPAAGIYPFELRFYEWMGSAQCNLYYRINDEAEWKNDLTLRFAYKSTDVQQEDASYKSAQLAATQKTPFLYGPWVSPPGITAQNTFTLTTGEKVYAVYDGGFVKMVSAGGVDKYFKGTFNDFKPASWNSYVSAQGNYKLKFV
jgi:hypothetical protein